MGKLCRLHLLLLALLLPGVSFAQNLLKVQGCVTDEQNEPLIGATVQTKDKSKGTITDSGGNYVLSGVPKALELILSENIIELQFTDNQILIKIQSKTKSF